MKFKAALALATLASFSTFAQTEIYVQDLNFIPKAKQFYYEGDIEFSTSKNTYEIVDTGSLQEANYKGSEVDSTHMLGYGITDNFTVAAGLSYKLKSESKLDSVEINGATQNDTGTTKNDGLSYLMVGGNYRFLNQNTNSLNGDFSFSYATAVQDAKRGRRYDSNGDGDLDSGTSGNSALIGSQLELGIFLGKKLEKFEVRGGLSLMLSQDGDYKLISSSNNPDLKINQDSFAAIQYILGGQITLNEQFLLYGNLSATFLPKTSSNYRDTNSDKVVIEDESTTIARLSLGGKFIIIPNKMYIYSEISGVSYADQKTVTKTNGVRDYISEKTKDATSSSLTVGLAAAF